MRVKLIFWLVLTFLYSPVGYILLFWLIFSILSGYFKWQGFICHSLVVQIQYILYIFFPRFWWFLRLFKRIVHLKCLFLLFFIRNFEIFNWFESLEGLEVKFQSLLFFLLFLKLFCNLFSIFLEFFYMLYFCCSFCCCCYFLF